MSNVFFFRLHKLRRRREEQQRQLQQQQIRLTSTPSGGGGIEDPELGNGKRRGHQQSRGRSGGRFRRLTRPTLHCPSLLGADRDMLPSSSASSRANSNNFGGIHQMGRLFERPTNLDPSDSLDYIALQIPRYIALPISSTFFKCLFV